MQKQAYFLYNYANKYTGVFICTRNDNLVNGVNNEKW